MKAKLYLVMLSLVSLALSGCIFEAQDEPAQTATDSDAGVDPTPSATQEPPDEEPAPPAPPTANLTARNVSGETPLTVAFDLSSDESDAKFLDWSFDADGDGTADKSGYGLPAKASFTYEEAGNFTALLTVTDVHGLEGNATLDITVSAPPPVVLPDPVTFNGTITGVSDNVGGYAVGEPVEHAFNLTVPVTNLTVTFTSGETAIDLDFVLLRPDGEEADSRASFNEPTGIAFKKTEDPIVIEDQEHLSVLGVWKIVVEPYLSYEGDYSITVTFA